LASRLRRCIRTSRRLLDAKRQRADSDRGRRPRWPSGKVSALGPEGSRFETRFAVYGSCCTLNPMQWPNVPSLVRRGSLERGCQLRRRRRPRRLTEVPNYEGRPKMHSCCL
ncbi:hypothetical protein AVEN_171124-1, partial [Araneus ventricosus]